MRKIEYLGHIIGGGELAAPEHRAAAMAEHRLPRTKKQLRSFLGAASYYRKFGQGFARMSSVLSPWTAKLAPSVVEWTEEGLLAFRDIKVSLVHLCILTIPSEEDVFLLHYDASGAGRTFTVITDHKALVSFLKSKVLNRRLQGWMQQLLQYDFSIEYQPGVEHLDADALSRQAWQSSEGDPWRPAAILQREEKEQEEADKLRAATNSQLVGGDVGTSPTGEKKQKEPRKD